jgi:hypothetical protein
MKTACRRLMPLMELQIIIIIIIICFGYLNVANSGLYIWHNGAYFHEFSKCCFRSSCRASNNEKSTRKDKITYTDTVGACSQNSTTVLNAHSESRGYSLWAESFAIQKWIPAVLVLSRGVIHKVSCLQISVRCCSDFLKLFLVYNISNITGQSTYTRWRTCCYIWRNVFGTGYLIMKSCQLRSEFVLMHIILWRIDPLLGNGSINMFPRRQILVKQPLLGNAYNNTRQ